MKFRKKPVVIDAIKWNGLNLFAVTEFISGTPDLKGVGSAYWDQYANSIALNGLRIQTLEGEMAADCGDWIIRGVKGEFYPCKPDIFEATYEAV
jgi:hypothetical protein